MENRTSASTTTIVRAVPLESSFIPLAAPSFGFCLKKSLMTALATAPAPRRLRGPDHQRQIMTTPNHQSLSTSTRFPPKSKRFAAFLLIHAVLLLASLSADASTRLAIGTFGLTPEKRDGQLADLIAAH